jgi:hypothetical protein
MQAKEAGLTVEQLLGIEELPVFKEEELRRKYVRGQPLVKPEKIPLLSPRMRDLHDRYLRETLKTDRESLMVKVKAEHYFHAKDL